MNLARFFYLLFFGILLLFGILVAMFLYGEAPVYYEVQLEDASQIYDGDTLKDVAIKLKEFETTDTSETETLWPGIVIKGGVLYVVTDVRLSGIDTPEKRPLRSGRTAESLAKEKAAAAVAQSALAEILSETDMRFYLSNPQLGKYAGRIVSDVYVKQDGKFQNVSELLIEGGHAIRYDGGEKVPFDEWYEK